MFFLRHIHCLSVLMWHRHTSGHPLGFRWPSWNLVDLKPQSHPCGPLSVPVALGRLLAPSVLHPSPPRCLERDQVQVLGSGPATQDRQPSTRPQMGLEHNNLIRSHLERDQIHLRNGLCVQFVLVFPERNRILDFHNFLEHEVAPGECFWLTKASWASWVSLVSWASWEL